MKLLALCISVLLVASVFSLSCLDEDGKPVDWFTLYKFPTLKNVNVNVNSGTGYAYMKEGVESWVMSQQSINDSTSLPGLTLNTLYTTDFNNSNIGYLMYNDQFNNKSLNTRAHAKGVLIFDETSAVWIVHSIPEYPPQPSTQDYRIGSNQLLYAQSMLCVSLPFSALSQVGQQLLYIYPQIYDSYMPDYLQAKYPCLDNLIQVMKGNRVTDTIITSSVNVIQTVKNIKFVAFHKNSAFNDELFSVLVAPSFKSPMFTETWSRGTGTLDTNCTLDFPIYNVERIKYSSASANLTFSVYTDHSKWGLTYSLNETLSPNPKFVCIGDINRQTSQAKRGGGTLCFKNVNVWQQYYNLIDTVQTCDLLEVPPNKLS